MCSVPSTGTQSILCDLTLPVLEDMDHWLRNWANGSIVLVWPSPTLAVSPSCSLQHPLSPNPSTACPQLLI